MTDKREKWRPIPSLPDYLASSHGRIMKVPYPANTDSGQGAKVYGGVPWYGSWDGSRFVTYIKKEGKTFKIHRIVCEAFHGTAPFEDAVVMHINEDASDNRPENLRWGTQKENLNAPGFLDYCRGRTGDRNPYLKGRARKETA